VLVNSEMADVWGSDDAAELYGIRRWGAGYFDLSEAGEVVVKAQFDSATVAVSLPEIIAGIRARGMALPVMLRIENILDAQITVLNESFRRAIKECGYRNDYRGVYPIKVNQQCPVIEEIARFGQRYGHGFEAGSKAELLIALAYLQPSDSHIICNGYKDGEFISLALHATRLGYRCFFVVETPAELPLILDAAERLGIRPLIGVRVKLSARVTGYWTDSSGDRSIFGLTTTQIVDMLDTLNARGMLDCLQLLHYHLGSQIPNIRDIRASVREACRFYMDLVKEGAAMGYMDLGGGLAVDYDGSAGNGEHSKNYSTDEYAMDIVESLVSALDAEAIPHPVIITESGRATVAYSSVLLFSVLDVTHFEAGPLPESIAAEENENVHNLKYVLDELERARLQESYNDAVYYRDEVRELYRRGQLGLRSRSLAENLFLEVMRRILERLEREGTAPPELKDLSTAMADIYHCNFSVFQSLPDMWAIGQVFPVMPVHRLCERPTRKAVIADITCDSDGRIDTFVGNDGVVRKTLPVHPLENGQEYDLGVFLVGAYQETLGDLHNLMGDTHVVSVRINDDGGVDYLREMEGDSIADVLSYVEYQPQWLLERFRDQAERAVRRGHISARERQQVLDEYSASLRGYTYFETE
jgi:arginine decarboxylase